MKRIVLGILLSMILFLIALLVLVNGCNTSKQYSNKPNDNISSSVCSAVKKEVYYLDNTDIGDITFYNFLLAEDNKKNLYDLIVACDSAIEGKTDKIGARVGNVVSYGVEFSITLMNYSDTNVQEADYDGLKVLEIKYPKATWKEFYMDPDTFRCLEDIRILRMDREMKKKAMDEGIDWYKEWPNLEAIETLP
ncbi:MAG: hypothetical protein K6E98_05320 [Lachnospiraceae bacterium]|nr:hypothetical protein [Lachnospiraceae bacterium]